MSEPKKTESFAGNVMKYSIATYLGFGISGAALIIKGVLPAESYAVPASFMAYTMSLMNVGMLGLDQSLLRFYHEPPAGSTGRSMFAACTRLSVLVMLLAGESSIREIIPFPMNKNAQDVMMGAPSTVEQKQLDELHIAIVGDVEKDD